VIGTAIAKLRICLRISAGGY